MKFDGWVLRNLKDYGNSLLPDRLIETVNNDLDVLKNIIEFAYEKPVRINKSDSGYIVEEVR
jgi:hypothetical protein